jgi:hypothetical protein
MKYSVFISYSWKREDDRKLIVGAINGISDIEVVFDEELVDYGDENLWAKIRDALGKSDLIIALLSEESIVSSAVIDELARAHDRGIKIIPILSNDLNSEDPRIPYYLRQGNKYMEFNKENPGEFVEALKSEIINRQSLGENKVSKVFSRLRNRIVDVNRTKVSNMILAEVIDQARLEVKEINAGHYEVNLGTEYDFLKRAKPLFGSASSIYATTVSSVSSFWTDKENKGQAIKYLLAQNGKVIRIFIFDKPDSLIRYREILDANFEQYGKEGAVFITSKQLYLENIVGSFCTNEEAKSKLLGVDFAILEYASSARLFAWLRGQYLGFKDAENPHTEFQVDANNFSALLDKMASICNTGFCKKYGVVRWDKDKSNDKDFLVSCVDDLFGTMLGDLSHIVLIKDLNNKLASTVARVKHNITILTEQYGESEITFKCNDIWFGENILINGRDKVYGGELIHNQDYKYMLYMRLPTKNDLEQWYYLEGHSDLRKQLYCKLVSSVSELYDDMDDIMNSEDTIGLDQKKIISGIYDDIEDNIRNKLTRMDFQYSESPKSLVDMPPYPFIADYNMQKDLSPQIHNIV